MGHQLPTLSTVDGLRSKMAATMPTSIEDDIDGKTFMSRRQRAGVSRTNVAAAIGVTERAVMLFETGRTISPRYLKHESFRRLLAVLTGVK